MLEPEHGIIAIGSGGNYALAAARDKPRKNCRRNCKTIYRDCIDICVFTTVIKQQKNLMEENQKLSPFSPRNSF